MPYFLQTTWGIPMSATEIVHDSPSPERSAFITPVLGAPRHTTDLELMNSRLPSIRLVSPAILCISMRSFEFQHEEGGEELTTGGRVPGRNVNGKHIDITPIRPGDHFKSSGLLVGSQVFKGHVDAQ